ncbi:Ig-like domain-containing protein [Microcella sp.]|uniref:Ig-like domain-containing protein n=1 Tax=Microcella sp. TaxID=1913979 RepID=UPI00391D5A41
MSLTAPALPAEIPPHHRPVPRILAAFAAVVLAPATAFAGSTSSAHAAENTAPIAVPESFTVETGVTLTVPAPGLLANDIDAESAVTIGQFTSPNWGTGSVNWTTGAFTYTSPPGFVGDDFVHYMVIDAEGVLSSQVSAKITVTPAGGAEPQPEPEPEPGPAPNTPPVGVDDWYYVTPGQQYSLPGSVVLANATDADGDPITVQWLYGLPGDFTLATDGSIEWSVPADFCGTFDLQYRPFDGIDAGNLTTVQLRASADASGAYLPCADPVATITATDDLFFVEPGQSYSRSAMQGLLANDQHSAGTGFEVVSYSEPASGAFALLADGSFTWTAPADFCDVLTFTYVAGDGAVTSEPATVTLFASISGNTVECDEPADEPGDEPVDQPGSPTIPTLPLPSDPGAPVDEPGQPEYAATPGRDGLAQTGADELAQGIGWGALLAILLGLGLMAPRLRRGPAA